MGWEEVGGVAVSGVAWEDDRPFKIGAFDWVGRAVGIGGMGTKA